MVLLSLFPVTFAGCLAPIAWAALPCLRALYEKAFVFIHFRFVAFHFPELFVMHHGVSCFFWILLHFVLSSLLKAFRSLHRQVSPREIAVLLPKSVLFLLGKSFACAQWLQCICDLTPVKLSWIRFSFSKQQICDLFLKWCILFQSNSAPCLPFCSFVYLWTVLQVYKWTELPIASYCKDTRTFLAKILLSHFSLALHVVPPLLPTAMSA